MNVNLLRRRRTMRQPLELSLLSLAMAARLRRLLQKHRLDDAAHDDFAAARSMLETMPLFNDQFDLACTRLENAQHYLQYTEPGAARYELRMLAGSLKNFQLKVRESERRLRHKA